MKQLLPVILLVLIFSLPAFSQKSKAQLEKEKADNLRKIQETQKIIRETQNQKEASLGQLSAIKQQVQARQALIISISKEVDLLNGEISANQEVIDALKKDLEDLKKEYAAMIYAASKVNSSYDRIMFIFSAESFNQMLMRMRYFQHYADMRKIQVEQIEKVKLYLEEKKDNLNNQKKEKNALLASQAIESENLNNLLAQQDLVVQQLSTREKELKKELENRKKEMNKLEKLIADAVKKEIEKAKKAAESAGSKIAMTPEAEMISSSFSANMKKLIWPVTRGEISHKFGKQPHPVLKNVYIDNLGVDILTLKGEQIRAVFEGKVTTVASVPGMSYVVMIQHGDFFTVYARLKTVYVKTGQTVKAKDVIGEVFTDKNDVSELQFQIWKNNEKLDPEKWLFKK
ncbi:MAG: murein hydrolase activator EnvC family protein [Cytophagaceae bacterium]